MIARRAVLATAVAFVAVPSIVRAENQPAAGRLSVSGSREQGSLVIGKCASLPTRLKVDGRELRVTPAGIFAFGLTYDQTRTADIEADFSDDYIEHLGIIPVQRQYATQSVNGLPQNLVTPSPEDLERIKRENALIYEARTRDTDGVGFAEPFDWPFPGIISSVYGSQRIENGTPMAPHLGVDIAAPEGTPIHAPADAVVSISDDYLIDGGFTLLDHGHGVSTCYLHQSKRMAAVGDKVVRGDVIGLVGRTGRATGPHTHWGLCWFQLKLDPSRSTRTLEPPKS